MLDEDQRATGAAEAELVPQPGDAEADTGAERPEEQRQEGREADGGDKGGDGAETGSEAAGDGSEADKPPVAPWFQRRIDELTRARHEETRRREAVERELQQLRDRDRGQDGGGQRQDDPRQDQRRDEPRGGDQDAIRSAAEQMRAAERFDEQCNTIFEAGSKQFPDFERQVGNFKLLGGLDQDFIADAIEAGNAHAVLHHLGRNMEEAQRIMGLPPRSRAVALARLSDKLSAPPPPRPLSKAPAPIDPVNGRGQLDSDPDKLSTDEWMRRRNAGEIK